MRGLPLRLRARRRRRLAARPSIVPLLDPAMLDGERGIELLVRVFRP
jgi:hypothetical protein